jgi:hypothetical protein
MIFALCQFPRTRALPIRPATNYRILYIVRAIEGAAMKRAFAVVAVIALVGVFSSAQQPGKPSASGAQTPSVAAQLEQIEHKWAESELRRDPAMIAPYLDAAMAQTTPDGSVSSRKEVLDTIGKNDPTLKNVELADMKTLAYGDAAVVMGRYTETRESNGKPKMTSGRFTDTFVKRDGKWKCVASHASVASH